MITLTQRIGDTVTHRIPLRWANRPFAPGNDWHLIYTVKTNKDTDTDEQAKIQKASGVGITVSGSTAQVEIVPQDTDGSGEVPAIAPGSYDFDIQVRSYDTGDIRTVADGQLVLIRDITRDTETSVPIYTTNPPLPGIGGGGSGNIDGGFPNSDYASVSGVDGGTP